MCRGTPRQIVRTFSVSYSERRNKKLSPSIAHKTNPKVLKMECGSLDSMFEPTEENMQMKNSTKPYLLFLSGPPDDIAEQNMLNMLSG